MSRPAVPVPEGLNAAAVAALAGARRGADASYTGRVVRAAVVDIHDGDTIRIVFVEDPAAPAPKLVQHVVRINGYDSPEVHPPASDPRRDEIRAAGAAARAAVADLLGFDIAKGAMRGALIIAALGAFDKYGRLLAELYSASGTHVNAAMIASGFGVAYGGGSKSAAWAAAGTTVGGDLAAGASAVPAVVKKPRAPRAPRAPKLDAGDHE